MRHVVLITLAVALAAPLAGAHERCRPIRAALTAQISTASCDSPVGLCTTGALHGGLHGTTRFSVVTLAASAGLDSFEPASTLSYLGRFALSTCDGELTVSDVGLLDNVAGAFTEIWRVTGGSGDFAGATGTLWLSGTVSATGAFDGNVTGTICRP